MGACRQILKAERFCQAAVGDWELGKRAGSERGYDEVAEIDNSPPSAPTYTALECRSMRELLRWLAEDSLISSRRTCQSTHGLWNGWCPLFR